MIDAGVPGAPGDVSGKTSGRVGTGDIVTAYELSGPANAPVALLAHCFATDRGYWDPHLPAFEGLRVLRYDIRGHGESDKPPGAYRLATLAGDALGLLDALGIERAHFCGVSLGGMIGQTIAIEHPDRLLSLVLATTTCEYGDAQRALWRERSRLVLRQGMAAVLPALMERWFTDEAASGPIPGYAFVRAAASRFPPASFASLAEALCALDTRAGLPSIRAPALVVASPDDPGVPAAVSEAIATAIPGAALHWLSPSRHLATLEQVETFNALVRAFLARTRRDARKPRQRPPASPPSR